MPADYIIDPQHGVVCSRGYGVFCAADYQEHMIRLLRDPQFRSEFHQLVDCRDIVRMDLNGEQIAALASRSVFSKNSRRAFIAPALVQFGLSRMLASHRELADGQEVGVFREWRDALAWLGLPADYDPRRPAPPPTD
jgi:hypothetical protein